MNKDKPYLKPKTLMTMNKIKFFSIILLIMALASCSDVSTGVSDTHITELLDRPERIQNGKEWDTVQNAYTALKSKIGKNSNDTESMLNLAALFIREARITGEHGHYYPAALALTEAILKSNPSDNDILYRALVTKAGVQLSLHDFAAAEVTGKEALKYNPLNAQVYGVLVDANVELGQYDQAVALADKMISIKPDLRSYARIAYLREIFGDVEGSIDALALAIDAGVPGYEERAWAMQTLGDLYLKYGYLKEAEQVYEQILLERADYPFAIAGQAKVSKILKNYPRAVAKFEEAAAIIPEVGYYIELAHTYKDLGDYDKVKSLVNEILPMLEDDVAHGHNMNLEYAHLHLDLLDDANTAFEYAQNEYKKRPANIDINKVMAEIFIAKNEIEKAQSFIEVAAKTNSKDPILNRLKTYTSAAQLSMLN
jgi:tetratricopeptide (TPR) repeat protein